MVGGRGVLAKTKVGVFVKDRDVKVLVGFNTTGTLVTVGVAVGGTVV